MRTLAREDGVALVIAIMALLLMTALGTALILTSSSETLIAAHFRDSLESRDAAGAMIERSVDDLTAAGDWTLLSRGAVQSTWVDGPPSGTRTLTDGSSLDLVQVVNLANCSKTTACSAADITAVTADRPWGDNNPQWQPYAYGPLTALLPAGAIESPYYVLLLVGAAIPVAGLDVLALRAEAYGPRGAHAVVEATAARTADVDGGETGYNQPIGQGRVRILSWREVR